MPEPAQTALLTLSLLVASALNARTAGRHPLPTLLLPAALGLLTTVFPSTTGLLTALTLTLLLTILNARGNTHALPVALTFALYVALTAGLVSLAALGLPVPAPLLATTAGGFLGLAAGTAALHPTFAAPRLQWLLAGVIGLNAYVLTALLSTPGSELIAVIAALAPALLHRMGGKHVAA
ncbi:hypothetical protein [Deinococcus aquatilis]|uniref:hypothetical protein n=1 Tax=Deinococcus aquatilis TaxID=519440 RepID=UPI0003777EF8|nr:hypothetical protein [Deinococcus aquatilis]